MSARDTVMTLRARVSDQLSARVSEQTTPLVRYGAVALAAILAFLLLSALAGAVDAARVERTALVREHTTLVTLEPQAVWAARLEEAERLGTRATDDVWRGDTLGIVKAELESALRAAHVPFVPTGVRATARDARPQVTVDAESDTREAVPTLGFSMTARVGRDQGDDFLAALATLAPPLFIEELTLNIADNRNAPAITSVSGRIRISVGDAEASQ